MKHNEPYDHHGFLKDRYLKVADISEGSYGLVSMAKDTKADNKLVAVKYIFPFDNQRKSQLDNISNADGRATSSPAKLNSNADDFASPKTTKKRLDDALAEATKETRIHKVLGSHPNITNLLDHFDTCLVLEYCIRGDLYEAIQSDMGPSTSQDIKDVFVQILNALSFCHSRLVYHRDLKPENILISDDWSIKICDWGLATTQKIITNKNEFDIGSERYMAPELFDTELDSYDASKVDLWSVGVILLTLVFHKNPFQVANYTDKRFLQFSANREALFDFFSSMTGELFSATRFCLTLDPQNRDLENLRSELENLKFFTIDEEYWAIHSDDEADEEEEYDEEEPQLKATEWHDDHEEADQGPFGLEFDEDEVFKFDKDLADQPPPEALVDKLPKPKKHIQIVVDNFTDDKNGFSSKSDDSNVQREDSMPHNRRAEALLSPVASARPIPIGGAHKIRNTRTPFGVASYNNKAHTSSSRHGFFSHQGNGQANHGGNSQKFRREDFFTPKSVFNHYMDKYGEQREQEKNERDRRRKWKRGRKKQSWKRNNNQHPSANHQQNLQNSHHHSGANPASHDPQNRRKHTNWRRRVRPDVVSSSPQSSGQGANRSAQKYVPPSLRSPLPKSAETLHDDIDHLNLNDGLFHLEEDLWDSSKDSRTSKGSLTSQYSSRDSRAAFAKESQKYVPPFRRGSHTGGPLSAQPFAILNELQSVHGFTAPGRSDAAREKRRYSQQGLLPHFSAFSNRSDETSRSVPGESWFKAKKNWCDYE